jgi:TolA-binding protein
LLAVSSSLLGGCFLWTTRGEGDELTERTESQEQRLQTLETGIDAERRELTKSVGQAKARMAELEALIEQATAVVTRNSADIGLEVQQLREQISRLEGQIAELRNEVQQTQRQMEEQRTQYEKVLKQAVTGEIELDPNDIPSSETDHYATAYRAFQASEWAKARALFRVYVERYAQNDQADNAQYWLGATYLRQSRPANALGAFRKVLSDWPRGDAVDETLLDMADAFYQLQACTDARSALEALIRSHPRSPLISRARAKLREVQNAPRGHCAN